VVEAYRNVKGFEKHPFLLVRERREVRRHTPAPLIELGELLCRRMPLRLLPFKGRLFFNQLPLL
jgi:hypothetical protein